MSAFFTMTRSDHEVSFAEELDPDAAGSTTDTTAPRREFRIAEGRPTDFQKGFSVGLLCSARLREVIDTRCGQTDLICWEAATVYDPKGDSHSYFVLQFNYLVDAFDENSTLRGPTGSLVKPVIDPVRAEGHHILPYNLNDRRFIVSKALRADIKTAGCTGTHFDRVRMASDPARTPAASPICRPPILPTRQSIASTSSEADRESIRTWWSASASSVPPEVAGLWFGLAEVDTADGLKSMLYLAGTPSFDPTDSSGDWAAETCWEPSGTELVIPHTTAYTDYRAQLAKVRSMLETVGLDKSAPPHVKGAAVGFDDGDFEIILDRTQS